MALDTAAVMRDLGPIVDADRNEDLNGQPPSLESEGSIGSIFRAVREFHGLDLEDLAQTTRIRRNYLAFIEDMRIEALPSRPFTIGYVRAYAQALGLDPEGAVARFKQDAPDEDEPLRAPVGVRREGDPRLMLIAAGAAVVVAGVVLWNIAQRAVVAQAPAPPPIVAAPVVAGKSLAAAPAPGPLALGAPLPAPPESTTPKPYVTPGLEAPSGSPDASSSPADAAIAEADAPPAVFTPKGTVYGAVADPAAITLQARRAVLVVIHGADGSVYFARQLAAGEAFRAPPIHGLSADVSDPSSIDVYVGGAFKGALPNAKMTLSDLDAAKAN
jgi:cytoskeletal protein RodZ